MPSSHDFTEDSCQFYICIAERLPSSQCSLLRDHSNSSVFPLMSSQKSSLKHSWYPIKDRSLIKELFALTHSEITALCEEERRGGIGVHSLHFPPSRRMAAESRNKHHHYLQRALAATRKPVSSVWHCLVEYKRLSVWKVQERKRRVCGLVLQSKGWNRGREVLKQRLIWSPLKLMGKLPWTPAHFESHLKCTEGHKATEK